MTKTDLLLLARTRRWCQDGTAKRVREAHRLTLSEIAAVVDSTDATISRYESGLRLPRGEVALRYGRLLDELTRLATVGGPDAA